MISGIAPYERRCTYLAFPTTKCVTANRSFCIWKGGLCNASAGYRYTNMKMAEESNLVSITFDFGEDITPNYFFMSRVDLLKDLTEIRLRSSADNITFNNEKFYTSPLTLTGVRDNDLFDCFDPLAAARYWQVEIEVNEPSNLSIGKIFIGNLFDFGIEPRPGLREERPNVRLGRSKNTGGQYRGSRVDSPLYRYLIEYEGLRDEVVFNFLQIMKLKVNRYALLINQDSEHLINDNEVVHGIISRVNIDRQACDFNFLSFTFTEMRG